MLMTIPGICAAQDQPKSTEPEPETTKPETTKPDDAKPDDAKPDDAKPGDAKPEKGRPEATKSGESEPTKTEPPDPVPTPTEGMEEITTDSGLKYIDIVVGEGLQPTTEASVKVHYSGWLEDGTLFDTSQKDGEPRVFGVSQVIKGWTEALLSMKVGGKRKLIVPPELAYGERKRRNIPSNSTLTFELELVEVMLPPEQTPVDSLEEKQLVFSLKYWDIKVGEGETPLPTAKVEVHYSIWLKDGTFIDSSHLRAAPSTVPVTRLFTGWAESVLTMKEGGKRRIEVPPTLSFGRGGVPRQRIPPESTIILEVELLKVNNPPPEESDTETKGDAEKKDG